MGGERQYWGRKEGREEGGTKKKIFFDTGYMCGVYHHKLDKKREKTERIKRESNKKRCLAHQPRTEIEYT